MAGFVGSPRMNLLPCRPEGGRLVGEHGWTLPRPQWAPGESGRPLLLGLRAEDLSLDRRDESASLGGELYALEPLGDRTLVDVDLGGTVIKVKARPSVGGRARASRSRSRSTSNARISSTPRRATRSAR